MGDGVVKENTITQTVGYMKGNGKTGKGMVGASCLRRMVSCLKENGKTTISMAKEKYRQGAVSYEGEFENGKKHGHGQQIWANGAQFTGLHIDDERASGQILYDGTRFDGTLRTEQFGSCTRLVVSMRMNKKQSLNLQMILCFTVFHRIQDSDFG